MRLDVLLVKRGLFNSRQKAKEAIRRGFVSVEGEIVDKASKEVKEDAGIEILTPSTNHSQKIIISLSNLSKHHFLPPPLKTTIFNCV